MEEIDVLVIGSGIVGLAIARELAMAGREVIVAERETMPCAITSSRNSGVIHAGIYYPPRSLKATLCVKGKEKLYAYIRERNIAHQNCTKLIVAADETETSQLQKIKARATANGVDDLSIIAGDEAQALEPELVCRAALRSPSTGIVDVHELMLAFIADIEAEGGFIALNNSISHAVVGEKAITVTLADKSRFKARLVINAAGLGASRLARNFTGLNPQTIPEQFFAKGNYFSLSGKAPFSRLVYPVPEQGGLGVHFTINLEGDGVFGPDVEWLGPAENIDPAQISYEVDPRRAEAFYASIERYYPGIRSRQLMPDYSGIRPKLVGPGQKTADFLIQLPKDHGAPGLVNLFGIESPGLTSSMAIAHYIQQHLSV